MTCKIYLLKNKINEKCYVGQTWLELHKRFGKAGENYKNSIRLFNAIQSYGADNFYYELLAECETQEEANALEIMYIEKLNTIHPNGYNLKEGGSSGRHSDETKKNISLKISTKDWSEEALLRKSYGGSLRKGKKNQPHTEEFKQKNSSFMKDWHASNPHPMLGKTHTDEARAKISAAGKGRVVTEKQIEKAKKTRFQNPENLRKEQEIIADFQSGMTWKDITAKYNCGNGRIERILERNGISKERDLSLRAPRTHSEETKKLQSEKAELVWKERKNNGY